MPKEISEPRIVVSTQELKAALLFASTDESRFVINGICIETKPGKAPIIVATDGRRLAVIETEAEQEGIAVLDEPVVLHPDFVKGLCALAKTQSAWLGLELRPGNKRLIVHFIGKKTVLDCEDGATIDQAYPFWRATIPTGKKSPVAELALNSAFLGDFSKVAKLLDAPDPIIRLNLFDENGAIEVRIPGKPNFYGLIMPAQILAQMDYQPEFLGMGFTGKNAVPADDTTVVISAGGVSSDPIPLSTMKKVVEKIVKGSKRGKA